MTPEPMPLAPPPAAPAAARPRANGGEGRAFWRALFALATGFALPVAACYGLVVITAIACRLMQIPTLGGGAPAVRGSGPAVAVIRVEGLITSQAAGPFETGAIASAKTLSGYIQQANDDPSVRAILLHVNSPGGGVTASDVIYNALKQVDKPIVVLMGDTAASGGYYISMAADWIIANPNTLTGSIGVISEFPNASELLDEIGVDFVVVTSGPRKDFGSPYREMTPEERDYWQSIVDETYASFVAIVAEGRGLTADEVLPLADGRVYTGRQALEAGLVDALGYEADAIARAAELGGIRGAPRLIEYNAPLTLFDVLSSAARPPSLLPALAEALAWLSHPRLEARWVGP
jgi:protease-4